MLHNERTICHALHPYCTLSGTIVKDQWERCDVPFRICVHAFGSGHGGFHLTDRYAKPTIQKKKLLVCMIERVLYYAFFHFTTSTIAQTCLPQNISNRFPNPVGIFFKKTLKTLQYFSKVLQFLTTWEKTCLQRVNIRTCTRLGINVSQGGKPGRKAKKEIKIREGSLMQMYNRERKF